MDIRDETTSRPNPNSQQTTQQNRPYQGTPRSRGSVSNRRGKLERRDLDPEF